MKWQNTILHILYFQLESHCDVGYGLRLLDPVCPSVFMFFSRSICISVRLSVRLSARLLYACLSSFYMSACPSIFVRLSVLCACLSVYIPASISVRPSTCVLSFCRKSFLVILPLETRTPDIRIQLQFTLDSLFFPTLHISHFFLILEKTVHEK